MMRRHRTGLRFLGFISLLAAGCTEAVDTAARSSLASFLTQVFSAAVNATLNP